MKYARDIMTEKPQSVQTQQSLDSIGDLFLNQKHYCNPVLDSNSKCLGIITEIGLIKAMALKNKSPEKDRLEHHLQVIEQVVYCKSNTPVKDLVKDLVASSHSRILVVDDHQHLQGIISPNDVLRILLGEARKTEEMGRELQKISQQNKTDISVFESVFNASPFYMIMFDKNGQVLSMNQLLLNALGYKKEEAVKLNIESVYPQFAHKAARKSLEKVILEKKDGVSYTAFVKKNHELLAVDLQSNAIYDDKNKFICSLTMARDIASTDLYLPVKTELNVKKADKKS